MAKKTVKTKPPGAAGMGEGGPKAPVSAEPAPLDLRGAVILSVAFLAGGGLMTLEIVGGRVVAAHFGSHVFVWGGLIGIFMGALSLGYFFGGRLADRFPHLSALGVGLVGAGILVLIVPGISDPICRFFGNTFFKGNDALAIRWNPVFAILIIFTGPAVFLGSISPFTIRLLAHDVATMGRVTARVYALNALGSIAGTILTAFFLMSFLGNRAILLVTGALLILLGFVVVALARAGGVASESKDPEEKEKPPR